MVQTNPSQAPADESTLAECIEACFDCAQACTACADACIGEGDVQMLGRCIRLDLDCADFEKFRDEGLEEDTIATRLQGEGYRTAFMGKYLNGYPAGDPTYVPPGWDEWYGKIEEQELYNYH